MSEKNTNILEMIDNYLSDDLKCVVVSDKCYKQLLVEQGICLPSDYVTLKDGKKANWHTLQLQGEDEPDKISYRGVDIICVSSL